MSDRYQDQYQHRPINPMLGSQPKFGPIPSEHLIPWFLISFSIFFVCDRVLQLDWIWTILMVFWGCSTWWILAGSRPWKFLSKFVASPNWTRGRVQYQSIFIYMKGNTQKQDRRSKKAIRLR